MTVRLLLATRSEHKLQELRTLLHLPWLELVTLDEAGVAGEAVEDAATFRGNAIIKARFYCGLSGMPTLADDSGIEVDALGGAPGVYTRRFAGLVLAAPVGIKVGGVLDRDIADMHGIPRAEFLRLAWANPAIGEQDYASLSDTELAGIARGRESLAVFGWKPYMHNPRLRRWLHRIDIPTKLLWGEQDGIVSTAYGGGWKAEIAGATLETIPGAGHYPYWEQPETFAARVAEFSKQL